MSGSHQRDKARDEKRKQEQDQRQRQFLDDLRWWLSDRRGRRVAAYLLEITGVYRSSMTGNSHTFFNEGKRSVGLQMHTDILRACPDRYLEILKEFQDDRRDIDGRRPA